MQRICTSVLGAEVEKAVHSVHQVLLLLLQHCAVARGFAQLGLQLKNHTALPEHKSLQLALFLPQHLQLVPVPGLHFLHLQLQKSGT